MEEREDGKDGKDGQQPTVSTDGMFPCLLSCFRMFAQLYLLFRLFSGSKCVDRNLVRQGRVDRRCGHQFALHVLKATAERVDLQLC